MTVKTQCSKTAETKKIPFNSLQPVAMNAVHWTEGFWAKEFEKCHKIMIPSLYEAMHNSENGASLSNFAIAAGLEEGCHRGASWSDGDCYKFIQAMEHIYSITKDENLSKIIDKYISEIGIAQEEDGYISTDIQLTQKQRWERSLNLELYNMGHLMTAACVHFKATGKDIFLNIAIKAGDFLYNLFKPRPEHLVNIDRCPSNIMGAVDLYRTTGDSKYLELASIFLDMRGSTEGSDWFQTHSSMSIFEWYIVQRRSDWTQTRTPLREEKETVGHAVEAAFLWCGVADVYAETGEKELLDALERMWESMVHKKMYITGGIGAWHDGVSPHKDFVNEAFAKEYELPNRTAYNETCANIAGAMFNLRMLNITGDAKYADEMERALFNSILSAKDIEGRHFFYTNPLARANKSVSLLSQDSEKRWFTFGCFCCPPQLARTIAGLHEWAYGISAEGVWVHIYGGSELCTEIPGKGGIKLKQETGYPWDGDITFTIIEAPQSTFAIMLRIPGWSDGGEIFVNGKPLDKEIELGSYAVVENEWKKGDVIRLTLPMRVKIMRAHPLVEETRGRVCITRGPVVYCLESVDLPEGVRLDEVYLPARSEFTARHDGSLLGGVTLLEGKAFRMDETSWDKKLYKEAVWAHDEMIPITLIPYYAWCNRGESEMTVWVPVM